jgi:hypothetical protein
VIAVIIETGAGMLIAAVIVMARLEAALGRSLQRVHGVQNVGDALVKTGVRREYSGGKREQYRYCQ